MTATSFAPRTIAAARTARSRDLARHLRGLWCWAMAAMADACAAFARAWHHHDALVEMLTLDDRLLRDIGVTHGEILMAVNERKWTRAAFRLVASAFAREEATRTVEARPWTPARSPVRPSAARPGEAHRDSLLRAA
jgi:hypothetical protein